VSEQSECTKRDKNEIDDHDSWVEHFILSIPKRFVRSDDVVKLGQGRRGGKE
jgi:hypothetical protein